MSELKRHMGLFHLTMYGVGLILGAGIYVLIGEATGIAGDAVWISFALGSIVALFAGFSYAELSSVFPKAAAEYIFIKNAFKNNFFAFLIGWLTVITSIITAATVALGFGGYFAEFVDIPIIISAIGLLVILSIVNFIGIRESSWTNTIFTIIEASGLILIIIIGFTFSNPEPVNYLESPSGFTGVAIVFVLIFFAFIGFEDMANIAEEVRKPKKTIPKAIILSVLISGTIYILVSLAVVRVVNWEELATSSAPISLVAERGLGSEAHILLSSIALFAITNTVLITLVAGSRMFYGMAREKVFPSILGKIHFKTKTPWIAVVMILIISTLFTLIGDIVIVANITVFAIVITFAAVNLAVIVLRYTEPNVERKFKVPINIGKFPILPLFGLGISIYMGFQFEIEVVLVGLTIIGIGAVFYRISKNSTTNSPNISQN
ncbi:amino acid transporter [Nitrosopumilus zosterae]|uniref:Amino acid transporter n=1 Tax=Nitrosopumilus zosterae TaxID=718286 RepID=A0A2S2KTI2_9ARCH|nr:amino acid permease [Nitrosopumilus zosterae]BDQ29946.1 amino acid permease [Nitrosopumilus zosterae]GBH34953.1 amino acid transporter [Nitrosopumilus zosterae]